MGKASNRKALKRLLDPKRIKRFANFNQKLMAKKFKQFRRIVGDVIGGR